MKKRRFSFKNFLLVTVLIYGSLVVFPRPQAVSGQNPLRVGSQAQPLIIAHGGGNREFPDNTLEAYYHAFSISENIMLETDVNITRDGVLILSHDRTLDRKTNLTNALIEDIDYSYLVDNEVDFGYENPIDGPNGYNVTQTFRKYTNYAQQEVTPIDVTYPDGISARHPTKFLVSTLEELILAFPNSLINVEIKQLGETGDRALDALITLLDTYAESHQTYERIVVASFHRSIYDRFVQLQSTTHPQLLFSPQFDGVLSFYILQFIGLSVFYRQRVAVLQLPTSQLGLSLSTRSVIRTAHLHNIAVHYWTINDEATMRELIEKGVDGIMTDRPTLLYEVMQSMAI